MASAWRSPQALQLTLALVKPDAVAHPLILEAVHQQILSSQLLIVRRRELVWRREDCRRFYQEHEDSVASASREIAAFFPDFSEQRWYEEEEPRWRWGPVRYSPEGGVHCAAGTGGPA
uniref:NME/NM23 nucleoside diphosphate kinase 6 n=1 Tax=Pipistrellus kuhlii TaxID=59472 RepID=A0A7J7WDQ8_PIPKU|nr:NME/NM23 nucleoside diphosphate kinase 6 [Pipistrellus kuhlii]